MNPHTVKYPVRIIVLQRFILNCNNYSSTTAFQTVQGSFSAVEGLGHPQWASNAEPTCTIGTRMMFRIDSRAGTAGYSLAKKNYPVPSEMHHVQTLGLLFVLLANIILLWFG
jgi:hypothetical protein